MKYIIKPFLLIFVIQACHTSAGTFAPIRTGWNKITAPIGNAINKVGVTLTQNRLVQNKTVQKIANSRITKAGLTAGNWGLHTAAFSAGAVVTLVPLVLFSFEEPEDISIKNKKDKEKEEKYSTKKIFNVALPTIATIALGNWTPKNRYLNSMVAGAVCLSGLGSALRLSYDNLTTNNKTGLGIQGAHALATTYLSRKHRKAAGILPIALAAIYTIDALNPFKY